MEEEKYEILEVNAQEIIKIDAIEGANIDAQVSTAKQYPRTIRRSIDNSIVMVTMNESVARSCSYAVPRGGKHITGPSVHLAKVIVSNWGNMRTEAKVVQITDKQVISRGTAWDLENNVASAFEVRRSIIDSNGRRFSDDMITVTGNAANSIAYRNAVFAVIPKPIVEKVYESAQKFITGDLSDYDKLIKKRASLMATFKNDYNIDEKSVLKIIGKQTANQINVECISVMYGILQSLKDGDTTVDDLLSLSADKKTVEEKKETIKNKQQKLELP